MNSQNETDEYGTDNPRLEILEGFSISEDAADELADQFDDNRGLIKDLSGDGRYYLVRWPDAER